jgi:SlyX protein
VLSHLASQTLSANRRYYCFTAMIAFNFHGNMRRKAMTTDSRITDLETRLTYQEAAIEGLTRANLEQQRTIEQLQAQLAQVMEMLRQVSPGVAGPAGEEPPPPHY